MCGPQARHTAFASLWGKIIDIWDIFDLRHEIFNGYDPVAIAFGRPFGMKKKQVLRIIAVSNGKHRFMASSWLGLCLTVRDLNLLFHYLELFRRDRRQRRRSLRKPRFSFGDLHS